jgi:hypothetical protein
MFSKKNLHRAHRRDVEPKQPTTNNGNGRNAVDIPYLIHGSYLTGVVSKLTETWAPTPVYIICPQLFPKGTRITWSFVPWEKKRPTTDHSLRVERPADEAHTSLSEPRSAVLPKEAWAPRGRRMIGRCAYLAGQEMFSWGRSSACLRFVGGRIMPPRLCGRRHGKIVAVWVM